MSARRPYGGILCQRVLFSGKEVYQRLREAAGERDITKARRRESHAFRRYGVVPGGVAAAAAWDRRQDPAGRTWRPSEIRIQTGGEWGEGARRVTLFRT